MKDKLPNISSGSALALPTYVDPRGCGENPGKTGGRQLLRRRGACSRARSDQSPGPRDPSHESLLEARIAMMCPMIAGTANTVRPTSSARVKVRSPTKASPIAASIARSVISTEW